MPFEPRVVSPDDEPWLGDAQPDLSPDLEAVAERLRADAAMLAERYPADFASSGIYPPSLESPIRATGHRVSRARKGWWPAAVVAALSLMVLAAGWTVWRLASPAVDRSDDGADAVVADGVGPVAAPTEIVNDDATALPTVSASMKFGRAEALIMNVNGPELEAVLDLMETQDTEDPLLSL